MRGLVVVALLLAAAGVQVSQPPPAASESQLVAAAAAARDQAAPQVALAAFSYRMNRLKEAETALTAALERVTTDRVAQVAARAASPPVGLPRVGIDLRSRVRQRPSSPSIPIKRSRPARSGTSSSTPSSTSPDA